jgi:hypothetical protein
LDFVQVLMNDVTLRNAVANDVASVLQLHFDISGLDSPDLVTYTSCLSICVILVGFLFQVLDTYFNHWISVVFQIVVLGFLNVFFLNIITGEVDLSLRRKVGCNQASWFSSSFKVCTYLYSAKICKIEFDYLLFSS